jgi:hypothetical protein
VRASLAPYNDEAEVVRFADAVRRVAGGQLRTRYEQATDGTFAPEGGWPSIPNPLESLAKRGALNTQGGS